MANASEAAAAIRTALACGASGCPCRRGANTHCPCPAHERGDRHPSLTVHVAGERLLVNCKTGTPQDVLIDALKERGLWPERETPTETPIPQQREPQPLERLVAVYQYRRADGTLYAEKGRWERPDGSKTFRWRLAGEERWPGGARQAETPLWGADSIAQTGADRPVVFVEGEKAAEACRAAGLLGVAAGYGASQKDFGTALEVLRGRDVILWPDNDPAGREYMARLHGLIAPIARSVTLVTPPVPEKGDAWDYFAAGGSVEALLDYAPPTKPVVGYLAHDAVSVRVPTGMGVVGFTFSDMEKSARELAAEVEVRLEGPGVGRDPYSQRLNLLSASQRTELRRDLESLYGKGYQWPAVLNTALALARSAYLEQDRALRLREIPVEEEPPFLVETLIPSGAPVVFFADGSSGKSYLLMRVAIAVAQGADAAGLRALRGGVLYVDYEDSAGNWRRRMGRLLIGMGLPADLDLPIFHWPARGIPLHDQIDAVRRKVLKEGITLVIVDAAADACGGEPEKADVALRYFNALDKLPDGVATATIAHVTNQAARGEMADRPFGSAFWHNRPRRTWYVARVQEEESDVIDVGLYCKKVNDGRKPAPIGLRLSFSGTAGPVTVERASVNETPQLASKRSLRDLIHHVLRRPMPVYEIAEAVADLTGREFEREQDRRKFRESIAATLRANRSSFHHTEGKAEIGGRGKVAMWQRSESGR